MTTQEFSNIVSNPDSITLSQVYELENIIHEHPYFQSARAVHLRVLYTQNSYRYNKALKITASLVGDRTMLFDFITSKSFKEAKTPLFKAEKRVEMPKTYYDEAIPADFTQYVGEDVFEPRQPEVVTPTIEKTPSKTEEKTTWILPEERQAVIDTIVGKFVPTSDKTREIEESLDMGKPLDFKKNDKYSFAQWLEITRYQPIKRQNEELQEDASAEKNIFDKDDKRAKKFDLIDKFLEKNPKIEAKRNYRSTIDLADEVQPNEQQLMTETLAKVYLEQGKYSEAIHAYQILILKIPEKSRFFADQIKAIKKLQQNSL